MKIFLFAFSIFISIWFTTVNVVRTIRGAKIPAINFAIMSAAITAVITHFIGIW